MKLLFTIFLFFLSDFVSAAWTDSLRIAIVLRDQKEFSPDQVKIFSIDSIELHSIKVKKINDSTYLFAIRNHIDTTIHKTVRLDVFCKESCFTILLSKYEYAKIPQLITITITKITRRKVYFEFTYGIMGYIGNVDLKKGKD